MKSRRDITIWSPVKLCLCCGKFVVLLRLPAFGSKTDPRWRILCYLKGWDGNPFFTNPGRWGRGNAMPHPRKRYAQRMFPERFQKPKEPLDPFFSLETTESEPSAESPLSTRPAEHGEHDTLPPVLSIDIV